MIKSLYQPFRHWSDGKSIWIVSDTHFNDNDCMLMDPNWLSPEDHIYEINRHMKGASTLIHLGDVGDPKYIANIHCQYKVLITGNHDAGEEIYRQYFDEIYTGPLMIAPKLILSHEPLGIEWAFNLHGHDHNKANIGDDSHLNLAANVVDFQPMNLGKLIKSGIMSHVKGIHRQTIDRAAERR